MNWDNLGTLLLMVLLLSPFSIGAFFYGWSYVEKHKKPKVIILHIHNEEIPAFKIDEDDWKDLMENAEEIT